MLKFTRNLIKQNILKIAFAIFIAFSTHTLAFKNITPINTIQFQTQELAVGIPTENFNFVFSTQSNTNWCWAASIEMVLKYYGISISQQQIVKRTYGVDGMGYLPNFTGSIELITANLNNFNVDNKGKLYQVHSTVYQGAPTPTALLKQLAMGRPVIVAYHNSNNSGHAVVVTGAEYIASQQGPIVQKIIVRDPWPEGDRSAMGRKKYSAAEFASNMIAHWFIEVNKQQEEAPDTDNEINECMEKRIERCMIACINQYKNPPQICSTRFCNPSYKSNANWIENCRQQ